MVSQAKLSAQEAVQWTIKVFAHCKCECQYPIVFIPKFRKKVLYGKIRDKIREIIKVLSKYKKVKIIAGAVCSDHVHLCVSIPPKLSISTFAGYLKGKSALMIFDKHPKYENRWDRSFLTRGYYVITIENVNEETVIQYITKQSAETKNEKKQGYKPL